MDGRQYGMIFIDETGFQNHLLVFFFDIPADCGRENLVFSITQERDKVKHTFRFDAGLASR